MSDPTQSEINVGDHEAAAAQTAPSAETVEIDPGVDENGHPVSTGVVSMPSNPDTTSFDPGVDENSHPVSTGAFPTPGPVTQKSDPTQPDPEPGATVTSPEEEDVPASAPEAPAPEAPVQSPDVVAPGAPADTENKVIEPPAG